LIEFVVGAHSVGEALAVEFHHIEDPIAVLASIEKGVTSRRLQKSLFGKANLGRQFEASRKVPAKFVATSQCPIRPTPTSNNGRGDKIDVFGVAADDPVKVPLIPCGKPLISVLPSDHQDMFPLLEGPASLSSLGSLTDDL
jgi:hypothetical protein